MASPTERRDRGSDAEDRQPSAPLANGRPGSKKVTHSEARRKLDAIAQLSLVDRDLASLPGSRSNGERYVFAVGATGDRAGHDGKITAY